ncbi:hypothetical protein QYE76_007052 [Lolium multiflorum]|uniref:BTB domain-containing protein n=1 Tax=Lolium multiflorum TaxID=4521 RepID=A0AAD8RXH1_LOLMU|nr:hypothetical protein QYE76_007052 [Lolium multiflorum]
MMWAASARPKMGHRATSDVVVRLRTPEGRDEWLYCHAAVLAAGSGYFADRLSDAWPTCQILDSRYCVEVRCPDLDLSSHVNALRLLYAAEPVSRFGVRGALGVLRAAAHLACPRIAAACADYLESAPWDEADEEEILAAVPCLPGAQYDRVLARLRPADPAPATAIFLSAFRHATAAPSAASRELKSAAQEQLEYMLTEDDDAPLLAFDDTDAGNSVKSQVKDCVAGLLSRFSDFTSYALSKKMEPPCCSGESELQQELYSFVSDISWVCQVLGKLEMMKCIAAYWVGASPDVVMAVEASCPGSLCLKTRVKVIEISAKVLEAVAFGNVVLPAEKRCLAVKVWIWFAGITKHLVDRANRGDDSESHNGEDGNHGDAETAAKIGLDSEVWQGLESAITAIVMTLPSNTQAEILSGWLQSEHAAFLDLTEAFDAWCYRSKVARRRLSFLNNINPTP